MKKVLLIVVAMVVSSVVLTSCSSTHSCPAYGKVTKVPSEKRA
jgi:outer membrane murein-binding lipoprotein Lpp